MWKITGYDKGLKRITTSENDRTFHDFWLLNDRHGIDVEVGKHFGDHEYTSGTTVTLEPHENLEDDLFNILQGMIKFHND